MPEIYADLEWLFALSEAKERGEEEQVIGYLRRRTRKSREEINAFLAMKETDTLSRRDIIRRFHHILPKGGSKHEGN
jgi:hypothetical protein